MRRTGAGRSIVRLAAAPCRCLAVVPERAAKSLRQGDSVWRLDTPSALPELQRKDGDLLEQLISRAAAAPRVLLPRGYPDTVAPGYVGYTSWLAAGLFAHSFTVMVSTNALLSGFFTEMSAASWLMKDLLPPLVAGTLASRIRTLEANPKRWLGAACFSNSLLGGVEFLIPHMLPKETWMVLAICTNVGKMTGYLVIGASRAVLQKTLATSDNLGEITTKLGMLGMLMHCFGAATALTLIHYLGFWGQLAAISTGAVVGFYAPVRASQCVVMSAVTIISLRRLVQRWAEERGPLDTSNLRWAEERGPRARAEATCAEVTCKRPPLGTAQDGQPDGTAPGGTARWRCPSPKKLHDELVARWSFRHSLAARASVWREIALADSGELRIGSAALHVGPALRAAVDVAAVARWSDDLRTAGVDLPSGWALGAGGDGRLLLLYSTTATAHDVVEGFAVAWLAAKQVPLGGRREEAVASLGAASLGWLPAWRRDAACLREAMDAAGWDCASCCADDVSRRVNWTYG